MAHGLEIIGNRRGGVTGDRCPKASVGGKMVNGSLGAEFNPENTSHDSARM